MLLVCDKCRKFTHTLVASCWYEATMMHRRLGDGDGDGDVIGTLLLHDKGPNAYHILIPQGSSGSSTFFGVK